MKRSEITAQALREKGWKPCYHGDTRYDMETVASLVRDGARVEFEISTLTRLKFAIIDGQHMLCIPATQQEVDAQREADEKKRYEENIKYIDARNRARLSRRGRRR